VTTRSGPPDAVSSRIGDELSPAAHEPPPTQDDIQIHDAKRLEDIASTIQEYASLRFGGRAQVSSRGDIIDAVAAGVNFLGEELQASYSEIERKVADRTAELGVITEQLALRALHDELTGLPNRTLFWDRLSHRMSIANRRRTGFAVIFADLDKFKEINDTQGHAVGDRLLVDVASRIRGALRAGDSAARMGGDEFLVLIDDAATKDAALIVANRLSAALAAPYQLETVWRIVTASIGVAVGPEGFERADDVVAAADTAMYDAKQHGRGLCVLYGDNRRDRAAVLQADHDDGASPWEAIRGDKPPPP
jgi:diguanylate cyclase (GGDEF)-like protein